MDLGLIITLISIALPLITAIATAFSPQKKKGILKVTLFCTLSFVFGLALMYFVTSFNHKLEINSFELEVSQLNFRIAQLEEEQAKVEVKENTVAVKEEKEEPVVTVKKSPPESTGEALVATIEETVTVKEKKPLFNGELYFNVASIYKDSSFDQRVKAVISSGPQKIRRDGLTLFEEVSLENGGFRYVLSVIDIHDRHIKVKSEKYRL